MTDRQLTVQLIKAALIVGLPNDRQWSKHAGAGIAIAAGYLPRDRATFEINYFARCEVQQIYRNLSGAPSEHVSFDEVALGSSLEELSLDEYRS